MNTSSLYANIAPAAPIYNRYVTEKLNTVTAATRPSDCPTFKMHTYVMLKTGKYV